LDVFEIKEVQDYMVFVVGGAYQGKTEYVRENFGEEYRIIPDYQLVVRRQLQEGLEPLEQWRVYSQELEDKVVIISQDLGSGLVPMDPFERMYREQLGRVNCLIAKDSCEVIRVVCGVGTKIK